MQSPHAAAAVSSAFHDPNLIAHGGREWHGAMGSLFSAAAR
ncbi:hypothetical protein [Microbispora sitophila]|nr:hypothetical protein [Microbispora sitophila]